MTIHLREYQEQALAAEAQHRAEHPDETRLAIVMATGLGKTIVLAERARRFLEAQYDCEHAGTEYGNCFDCYNTGRTGPLQRVLILVHTDELAQQAEAKVRLVAGRYRVGVVKAERDETDADIIIGSVQTLANPARRQAITDVGLVIVDECHHATADSYQAIMRHFGCFGEPRTPVVEPWASMVPQPHPPANCGPMAFTLPAGQWCPTCGTTPQPVPALGLTATLERGDGRGLGDVWQNVAFTRDISWGVRKGYLVQPVGYRLEIDLGNMITPPFHVDPARFMNGAAGQDDQLIESLAPQKIVEKWLELASDRPTVAFMPLVRSARALQMAFAAQGVRAAVVHGDMPGVLRREYLADYERGDVRVLVNAMVLTEGWDSPRTKCVIVGRPTKSRSLFVQMAGRGLRPAPGFPVENQDCILLCVADSTTDLCSVADLSDKPIDRKAQGALTAMEDAWDIGAHLEEEQRHWAGKVDAREFDPLVVQSSKVWRTTKGGTYFLPISKEREYVFVVGTSVFIQQGNYGPGHPVMKMTRLHHNLPDLELALSVAEDEAQERGGDIGRLLADRNRAWRKQVPSTEAQELARHLGLGAELDKIMAARAGGKAGKVSDLINRVKASRALDPVVEKIKAQGAA